MSGEGIKATSTVVNMILKNLHLYCFLCYIKVYFLIMLSLQVYLTYILSSKIILFYTFLKYF